METAPQLSASQAEPVEAGQPAAGSALDDPDSAPAAPAEAEAAGGGDSDGVATPTDAAAPPAAADPAAAPAPEDAPRHDSCVLKLKGLPYSAGEGDVRALFEGFDVSPRRQRRARARRPAAPACAWGLI